jgi:hypothetical protein
LIGDATTGGGGTTNNIVRNNIVIGGRLGVLVDAGIATSLSNNLTTDPKFVNAAGADFHLQADSPAIDAGIAIAEVTTDFDGVARPQGAAYDIGAYEFANNSPLPYGSVWPAAPANLVAQCSTDGTVVSVSWAALIGATSYAVRLNYRGNDGPTCTDGWYCNDPPDKILDNYGGTSYVANVAPGQPYIFWVHGMQGGNYGNAGSSSFTCDGPPPPSNPPLLPTVATPMISPSGGNYINSVLMTLQTATAGALIYYTNDGSTPTASSMLYSGAITLTSGAVIKAIAFKSGYNPSSEANATFTIVPQPPPPPSAPTWPSAPINLVAQCSADGTQATVSWSGVNDATAYALRVNYLGNDGAGCLDGWYCSDPPDKSVENYGGTSYVANVTPSQPYNFWVHAMQGGNYGNAGSSSFTCDGPPPPSNPPPLISTIKMTRKDNSTK